MTPLLLTSIVLLAAVSAVLALVDVARNRDPGWATVGTLAALEVMLVLQAIVGFFMLSQTSRDVSGLPFSAYLIGAVLVPPIAFVWAFTERSRWGTAVLVVGSVAVIALEFRLDQIWGG